MPQPDESPDEPAFHEVLSRAIAERNLTLERISHRLRQAGTPLSIATLSYWQTGRSLPTRSRSLKAVQELEKVLRVPTGWLQDHLPGDAVSRWDPFAGLPEAELITQVLREMGVPPRPELVAHTIHDRVLVHAERQQQITRQLVEATAPRQDRFALAFRQDSPDDLPPEVEVRGGCRLGQVVELEDAGITIAEVVLPRPLTAGEMYLTEHSLVWDISHEPTHGVSRTLYPGLRYYVLDVTFCHRTPVRMEHYRVTSETDRSQRVLTPRQPEPFVQSIQTDPVPGPQGMLWEFAG